MAGLPATYNLDMIRGDDFLPQRFQIVTSDKVAAVPAALGFITGPTVINGVTYTPLDLTGATVQSQIRETTAYKAKLIASFVVVVINPLLGEYSIALPKAQSTLLRMSDLTTYSYDTQVVQGGLTTTYVMGDINIVLDVTQ